MRLPFGWIDAVCLSQRVFLSYSSEYRELAEELTQTLRNSGHQVFFDKESLPAGEDFNERIRRAMQQADCCIFFVSKTALEPGKYTVSELNFAKLRWPAPAGKVFPVIVDPTFAVSDLPPYLKSVQAIFPGGNVVAEVAAAIERARTVRAHCWTCLSLLAVASALCGVLAWPYFRSDSGIGDVALLPVERIDFRPRTGPPTDQTSPNAATTWLISPVMITVMSLSYEHHNPRGFPARILGEQLELTMGSTRMEYSPWAVVSIFAPTGCPGDWLCHKGDVGPETILAGQTTPPRETMFQPTNSGISWKDFIDQIVNVNATTSVTVDIKSNVETSSSSQNHDIALSFRCSIDLTAVRASFSKWNWQNSLPTFWEPSCSTTAQ
jgi:hypothetical protein